MVRFISKEDWESWKAVKKSSKDIYDFIKKYGVELKVDDDVLHIVDSVEVNALMVRYIGLNGWKSLVKMIDNSELPSNLFEEAYCLYPDGRIDFVQENVIVPLIEKSLKKDNRIKNITKADWEVWKKENDGDFKSLRDMAIELDVNEVYDSLMTNAEVEDFIMERMECDGWSWQSIQLCLSGINELHRNDDFFHLDSNADFQPVMEWKYYADIIEDALKNMFNW